MYDDGKIYLHCAKTGHKIDGIIKNPKVSFCVTAQDLVVPEEYTSYFKSVIASDMEGYWKKIRKSERQWKTGVKILSG